MKKLIRILAICLVLTYLSLGANAAYAAEVSTISKESLDLVDENGIINAAAYAHFIREASERGEEVPSNVDDVIKANLSYIELEEYWGNMPMLLGTSESVDTLYYTSPLSVLDGLSSLEAIRMYELAAAADFASSDMQDPTKDTYRHFYWNFVGSNSIGSGKCRIYTTNYEWVSIFFYQADAYANDRINYWILTVGLDGEAALSIAKSETTAKLKEWRNTAAAEITSYSAYTSYFSKSTMQDFYNNYRAQLTSESGSYSNVSTAFSAMQSTLATGDNPTAWQMSSGYNSKVWKI